MDKQITIIGAGIIGIWAAYYLAKNHKLSNIVLIDRNNPMSLTSAASGENYRNWWPQPEMFAFINRSIDLMEDIARKTKNRINITRRGYALATRHKDIDEFINKLKAGMNGLEERLLRYQTNLNSDSYRKSITNNWESTPNGVDVIQNRQLIGDAFPNYTEGVETVIHIRRGGYIDSQQLGQIMIEYLREVGVEFEFGNVLSIQKSNGYVVEYKSVDRVRTVYSDIIVNAAGPFAKDVAKMLGVELDLFNIYQQKIAFEDNQHLIPRDLPFSIDLDPQFLDWSSDEKDLLSEDEKTSWLVDCMPNATHCRPDGGIIGNWVKLGWAYNRTPDFDCKTQKTDTSFPEVVLRGASRLQPSLKAYYGNLPSRRIHFGGWYNMTNEIWPLIGPMQMEGAYMNCAMSGFGTMASCAAGELCATWIAAASLPSYADGFSLKRYNNPELMQRLQSASKGVL